MKHLLFIILCAFAIHGAKAQQLPSQTMQTNSEAHIDSTGNAIFKVSGKLTASQWQMWNYMYGGGQASMVKKNIERTLSSYYVYDFKYTPNEMDRTFTIEYKAKGIVEYLGKDKWVANMGMKDMQPIKIADNAFTSVQSTLNGNVVLQNNAKITLPANVSNMQFDNDEFGNVLIKYTMPTESVTTVGNSKLTLAGYSLLGFGVLSLIAIAWMRKKK